MLITNSKQLNVPKLYLQLLPLFQDRTKPVTKHRRRIQSEVIVALLRQSRRQKHLLLSHINIAFKAFDFPTSCSQLICSLAKSGQLLTFQHLVANSFVLLLNLDSFYFPASCSQLFWSPAKSGQLLTFQHLVANSFVLLLNLDSF
nr:hypothetical protein BgiMline_032694 [Biomphalaria glabrata]